MKLQLPLCHLLTTFSSIFETRHRAEVVNKQDWPWKSWQNFMRAAARLSVFTTKQFVNILNANINEAAWSRRINSFTPPLSTSLLSQLARVKELARNSLKQNKSFTDMMSFRVHLMTLGGLFLILCRKLTSFSPFYIEAEVWGSSLVANVAGSVTSKSA